MNNIMIDLETLSTNPNAAILTIAAVVFSLDGKKVDDYFYTGISMNDVDTEPAEYGHIDPSTVRWWMKESDDARAAIVNMTAVKSESLITALFELTCFIQRQAAHDDIKVWSKGASFDLPILRSAFNRCRMDVPWGFRNERDVRTLIDLGQLLVGFNADDIRRTGPKHDALADARFQAKQVIATYKALNKPR